MIWVVLRMDHVFLADLSNVLHKVHETFLALAAQLHEIHEAVKVRMLCFMHRMNQGTVFI